MIGCDLGSSPVGVYNIAKTSPVGVYNMAKTSPVEKFKNG
jgi:hypothetical protein